MSRKPRRSRKPSLKNLTDSQRKVYKLIKDRTFDDPIVGDDIALAVKLDVREVRQIIRDLRIKFYLPIGSRTSGPGGSGYWMMRTRQEAQQIGQKLWNRGWAIVRMAYKMKTIANSLEDVNQPPLEYQWMNRKLEEE